MGQCKFKKRYKTEKLANAAKIRLWGADPNADLNDLHSYICPVCGYFHVGHRSKYEESKKRAEDGKP